MRERERERREEKREREEEEDEEQEMLHKKECKQDKVQETEVKSES